MKIMSATVLLILSISLFLTAVTATTNCPNREPWLCKPRRKSVLACEKFIIKGITSGNSSGSNNDRVMSNDSIFCSKRGNYTSHGKCSVAAKFMNMRRKGPCYIYSALDGNLDLAENSILLTTNSCSCVCIFSQLPQKLLREFELPMQNEIGKKYSRSVTTQQPGFIARIPIILAIDVPARNEIKVNVDVGSSVPFQNCSIKLLENSDICTSQDLKIITETNVAVKAGGCEHTFREQAAGNYCVRACSDPLSRPPFDICYSQNVTLGNVPPLKTSEIHDPKNDFPVVKIMIGVSAVLFAICCIVLYCAVRYLYCRKNQHVPVEDSDTDISPQIYDDKQKRIFLVFHNDCPQHEAVISAFAEVLEKFFNCKVSFSNNDDCLNEILANRHDYIKNNLKKCDIIILINSEGGYRKDDAKSKGEMYNNVKNCDIFLDCLDIIKHNDEYRFNYAKLIRIRFEYTSRDFMIKDVVWHKHYELPVELLNLVDHIGVNTTADTAFDAMLLDPYYCRFLETVKEMKQKLSSNPAMIKNSLGKSLPITDLKSNYLSDINLPLQHHSSFDTQSIDISDITDSSSLPSESPTSSEMILIPTTAVA